MPQIALELFQEGRLHEAIQCQDNQVRTDPDNADGRLLLAELLLFDGAIDAARAQLAAIPTQIEGMPEYLHAYRQLLVAASKRQRLFRDVNPEFLLDPPEHLQVRLQALTCLRQLRHQEAVELLDDADSLAPWVTGHVDGREFEGVRDGDDLFGPLLEMFVNDRYVWLPFEQLSRLRLGERESLRDRLFFPAQLVTADGAEWAIFLPALYPDSHQQADDDLRLGHATDWIAAGLGPARGIGLHLLSFGDEELTLLDFTQWEKRR